MSYTYTILIRTPIKSWALSEHLCWEKSGQILHLVLYIRERSNSATKQIEEEGVRLKTANWDGLVDVCEPVRGAEISQYIKCANWILSPITRFSKRIKRLREPIEIVNIKSELITKDAVTNLCLVPLGWSKKHTTGFRDIRNNWNTPWSPHTAILERLFVC